ncbi:hypothetical protein B6U96_12245 [Archaeoglobales archaeon ex4484_92]|nr:MAG: hypothetical protein B6U96_12245 [Archaeoglobales archaeon ex4484_92]
MSHKILIFAADMAYRALDQAGLLHAHYPTNTVIFRIPCASMLRPDLIVYALKNGFDAVFVASSGPDCPFLGEECVSITAKRIEKAYELLEKEGIEKERLVSSGVCSTCVEAIISNLERIEKFLEGK